MKRSPHISVIIPAFHSAGTVAECLTALRRQTYLDFEVVLVNSSSEAETERIVTSEFPEVLFEQSPVRLYPHSARNRGVQLANGRVFVFTDPDCRARPDWLERIVAAHDQGHEVVGGAMSLIDRAGLERAIHLCKFSWLLPGISPRRVLTVCTANASYTRSVFEKIGPFNGNMFIGDAVLSWRAAAAGFTPWFVPDAIVEHHHEGSMAQYRREFMARGKECGRARIELGNWTRGRAVANAALFPALAMLAIVRIGRDALRAGWTRDFVASLPSQAILKMAWAIGEAKVQADFSLRGSTPLLRRVANE